jgi:hypothetical protein
MVEILLVFQEAVYFKHVQKGFLLSDMGPFLLHILVLLQASTWGCCPPQPVPLLRHAPSLSLLLPIGPGHFESNLYLYKYTSNLVFKRPMNMEQCSETSAHKIQMPGNNPKEIIQDCTSFDHPKSN